MALDPALDIIRTLTNHGFNAERAAVTEILNAQDPNEALESVIAETDDDTLTLSSEHVTTILGSSKDPEPDGPDSRQPNQKTEPTEVSPQPSTDTGADTTATPTVDSTPAHAVTIDNDVTNRSTGTGSYDDFVALFRDRYEALSAMLRTRVNHRPAATLGSMAGGSEAALIGMVNDIRRTANDHWLIELEDPTGTFPVLVTKDKDLADDVPELVCDEVVAVDGRLADDNGIIFVDTIHFPDIPITHTPTTTDRHVQAALISDVHVGSHEFLDDAWSDFANWLHTPDADPIEYLLIAGDMVEGVGVYPGQENELAIIDIYEQYETFAEHLKAVPGHLEIIMIPGNHDAVRLAEPQPAFDDELRAIMSAHDARITGNPSTVTVDGVSILMYHGVSLDEMIAEIPSASYDNPEDPMAYLLKKRHLAPQFGGRIRVAPEEHDYLVIDSIPDVFHAGHVHKIGTGRYHNVTIVNSGCWQAQTTFQRRVNIQPDAGYAPILDLDTLDVTLRKFT